jgi:hypothetical protein
MKYLQSLSALLLAGVTAQASLTTSVVNTVIPDGNPNGVTSTLTVGGLAPVISEVVVYLNVSGGFDGDLYATLNLGGSSGTTVVLLNRIGSSPENPFGSSAAGFGDSTGTTYEFSLSDAAATSIHNYDGTGSSYQPDGGTLSSFNGLDPDGDWILFIADMASGGGDSPSTLVSWGLDITAVPEPVNAALGVFAGIGLVVVAQQTLWRKRRQPAV